MKNLLRRRTYEVSPCEDKPGYLKASGNCVVTGEPYSVTAPEECFRQFQEGAYAQDAFPMLSADDREFLMSGIGPAGWRQTFSMPDEPGEE